MAEPTTTEPTPKRSNREAIDPAASSPELAPVMKVARARATSAGGPRAAVPKAAKSAGRSGAAASLAPVATGSRALTPIETGARPANVEIYQGGADTVSGDAVSITQGGASIVTARSVEVQQGGIVNAQADDINVRMGGVVLARADRVSVEMGGVGLALAREANLTQGGVRTIVAQEVRVDQGLVGTAFAGKVTFEKPAGVFLLIAGKTEGPVKALMDWRGALAFGAVFGLLVGLLRRR